MRTSIVCGVLLLTLNSVSWFVYYASDFDGVIFAYFLLAFQATFVSAIIGMIVDHELFRE